MCGIVGYWSETNFSSNVIHMMCDKIKHRGPDAQSHWSSLDNGLVLGHRRLSILDLSDAGKQPMVSLCGRYIIVYNGEIYNHLELRKLLIRDSIDIKWKGHSDTETLLACITYYGLDVTLSLINGMFAFALFDTQKKELILARDRVGEKPLYYGFSNKTFFFGSELKALKCHPSWDAEINQNALALYLRYNYVPAPLSIYWGVYKLPAGTYLRLSNFGRKLSDPIDYWDKNKHFNSEIKVATDIELIEELDKLLKKSISLRMLSDVPVGAFLSGGVDSSMVVALMQSLSAQPVQTFSIGFNEAEYNEAEYAKRIAKHLGTDHTELYVHPKKALDLVPQLSKIYDEPFADVSQIPTILLSQLTRKKVTVSLSGDGGDELFCGYNRYSLGSSIWKTIGVVPRIPRLALSKLIKVLPNTTGDFIARAFPAKLKIKNLNSKLNKLAYLLEVNDFEEFYQCLISHNKNPHKLLLNYMDDPNILRYKGIDYSEKTLEEMMMYWDFNSYLPDDILVKLDRATMNSSLEARVPFLDPEIIEFAWSLPFSTKKRNGCNKWLLKELLNKSIPPELMDRPKMGFGVPIEYWLKEDLRDWAESLLDRTKLKNQNVFDEYQIRKIWSDFVDLGIPNQQEVWNILMFQSWLEDEL